MKWRSKPNLRADRLPTFEELIQEIQQVIREHTLTHRVYVWEGYRSLLLGAVSISPSTTLPQNPLTNIHTSFAVEICYIPYEDIVGMKTFAVGPYRRTLDVFDVSKEDVLAYAQECGFEWYEDKEQTYIVFCLEYLSTPQGKACQVSQNPAGFVAAMEYLSAIDGGLEDRREEAEELWKQVGEQMSTEKALDAGLDIE